MNKQNIKYFFLRFKRAIVATSLCVLALAIIGVVAYKSSQNTSVKNNANVQVSAPTAITFIMPINNGSIIKDYSSTALKYNKTLKQWEAHKAVDIKGEDNADVLAVYGGKVTNVEDSYMLGTTVTISHNGNLVTQYSSLTNVCVKVGDVVTQGTKIGNASTSAKSESADGDHVHFEVYLNNQKVDPQLYLIVGDK